MTKKILTFGASNSKQSINKKLATYATSFIKSAEPHVIDLNDYEMPLYSIDRELAEGIPQLAKDFKRLIKESSGIIISFAEHNGSYTVAFKNVMDWASRLEGDLWEDKPMLLMATSPGQRGAQTVLSTAAGKFPYMGGNVTGQYSLPNFGSNYSHEKGITDDTLNDDLFKLIETFEKVVLS